MSLFKTLADRFARKREEIEREAAKKAAEKAPEIAIEQGKRAARSAVEHAGKRLEEALFGDVEEEPVPPSIDPRETARQREAARRQRLDAEAGMVKERAREKAQIETEVDEELAAMKKRMKKR